MAVPRFVHGVLNPSARLSGEERVWLWRLSLAWECVSSTACWRQHLVLGVLATNSDLPQPRPGMQVANPVTPEVQVYRLLIDAG